VNVPRVLLADDHSILLEAFRTLLEGKCQVVGAVSDGRALLKEALRLQPDAIVIDIGMPLLNGLEAARRLRDLLPKAKLIFLTMNEDPDIALEAMRSGASAYLLKTSAAAELFLAIRDALKGKSYVTPRIAGRMSEALARNPQGKNGEKSLTTRQREVLQLLAEGKSMKEAADFLAVTPRTIAFHKYRMMEELGLKSNAELIQFAVKRQIVAT